MRTGNDDGAVPGKGTFTQAARRAQLVGCAIDALAEVGYQQTTVAEVARRAGVSKGVVTYYFPARDDLVWAVVAAVFGSVGEHVGSRLENVPPGRFVATYLTAWTDYYRTCRREMTAIAEIWTSFRDASGRPHLDARTLGRERELVEAALSAGQADGTLGDFSPRVMAVTLKAALDGLLGQLAVDPALDLDAYREELIALFDRATSPARFARLRRFRGDLEPRRELAVAAVVAPANRQLGHEQQPPPVLGARVLALADGRMGGPPVVGYLDHDLALRHGHGQGDRATGQARVAVPYGVSDQFAAEQAGDVVT